MEECSKEKEISEMKEDIKEVQTLLKGDSNSEGLRTTVAKIQVNLRHQNRLIVISNQNTSKLGTAIRGLEKFQDSMEAIIRNDEKHKRDKRWLITTAIAFGTLLLGAIGTIIIMI